MSWLDVLIVAVWGMLGTQFVIRACLFLILFVFALIGFVKGGEKVPRSNNVAAMTASASGVAVFALLFGLGAWIVSYLQLDASGSIALWIGIAISLAYIAPQIPAKLKNSWRDALAKNAMLRRAFENAKNWPPKRSPETTPQHTASSFRTGNAKTLICSPTKSTAGPLRGTEMLRESINGASSASLIQAASRSGASSEVGMVAQILVTH